VTVTSGSFIVIDGPDGSGKSTQCDLLARHLEGAREVVRVRDPGGTPLGEAVREVLLDTSHSDMTPGAEVCLYMAARAQLAAKVIRPALDAGRTVLSDRYLSSTIVYQGLAGGISPDAVMDIARATGCDLEPDLLVVLDIGLAEAARRRRRPADRVERKDAAFHERVRQGFKQLDSYFTNVVIIGGAGPAQDVHRAVRRSVEDVLP